MVPFQVNGHQIMDEPMEEEEPFTDCVSIDDICVEWCRIYLCLCLCANVYNNDHVMVSVGVKLLCCGC